VIELSGRVKMLESQLADARRNDPETAHLLQELVAATDERDLLATRCGELEAALGAAEERLEFLEARSAGGPALDRIMERLRSAEAELASLKASS
jgi:DNA repair exonuclease SbcCD ATPase subunit